MDQLGAAETREPADAAVIGLGGERLEPRGSGCLWWPARRVLTVADLHLGKATRAARRGRGLLPPYETSDTLDRLAAEIAALAPETVICLGDSLDDARAGDELAPGARETLAGLVGGRRWIWVAGNHDPAPTGLGGETAREVAIGAIAFRHIARQGGETPEISGHYHPKAVFRHRGATVTRRCFLSGRGRVILPAFGTYTGGLRVAEPVFDALVGREARAILTGRRTACLPRAVLA